MMNQLMLPRAFLLGLLAVFLSACTPQDDDFKQLPDLSELQYQKINQFKKQSFESKRDVNGDYSIPWNSNAVSGVNSGYDETLIFAKNANVRIVNNIGFYVDNLVGRLRSNDKGEPVTLDNPQSFQLDALEGKITLAPVALEEILNEHIFNYLTTTLKSLKVSTEGNLLVLNGKAKRKGVWIPFTMKGTLSVRNSRYLILDPKQVFLDGNPASKLMQIGKIELDELLTVNAPGAKLKGSLIWLDSTKLLPPPRINFLIDRVSIGSKGVTLDLKKQASVAYPKPFTNRSSSMILRGGDMRIMRLLTLNAELNIVAKQESEILDFCFYDYRQQLSEGSLRLLEDGSAIAYLENYKHLDNK